MKHVLCALPVAIVIMGAVLGAQVKDPPPNQPVQTFRTATDAVLVDVSVRLDGRPVTSLRAEDFVLTDNGVRQRIESIENTAVPIDLTLIVDLSGNSHRRWTTAPARAEREADLRRELDGVRALLRPEDRIRVLAIDRDVQLLTPMSPAAVPLSFRSFESNGLAALYDTIAAALLHPSEPARRHVVIARTKGEDTISSIDARALRSIAERSDAVFHLVLMETALDNDDAAAGFQCQYMGICWPTRQFWAPFRRRLVAPRPSHALTADGTAVARGAESTGGALHKASGLSVPTLTSTFRRTFEDFRSGYLLRYTPQGIARTGWHSIEVKVQRSRDYDVRWRRGYAIDSDGAAPPSPPSSRSEPRTLGDITTAYSAGSYQAVVDALQQAKDPVRLIREFEEDGNPWPASPKREAVFALELAEAGVFSTRRDAREKAHQLLERFSTLVRHPLEGDVFERYWYFALLTMLEGAVRPVMTQAFVERALERFPNEPRFILSRAIAADLAWSTGAARAEGATEPGPSLDAARVRQYYEDAIGRPTVGTEARVRYAHFLLRSQAPDLALTQLIDAESTPTGDLHLRYLHALFKGHALEALERREEAAAAYRAALAILPAAQSARVALMNTSLLLGDRTGAEALAEAIQTDRGGAVDPWWMYWQGQYRLHGTAMARVREMSR